MKININEERNMRYWLQYMSIRKDFDVGLNSFFFVIV